MINTLIGKKIDQTQKFLENGKRIPVTLISVADNAILQVKTVATDGYAAMQLGHGTKKKPTKAAAGHSKKAGFDKTSQIIKEVRLEEADAPVAGENLAVEAIFKPGDIVTVTGTSKGKGFAGVVKRHNFRGGPKTHGQSDRERAPGSIGQTTTPGRVYRGKKMAGRMGSETKSLPNLTVVDVNAETKTLLVTGLVPGSKQSILTITKTGERKNFSELIELKIKREALEAIEAEKQAKIAAEEAEKAAVEAEKAAKLAEKEAAKVAKEAPVEPVVDTTVEEVTEAASVVEDVIVTQDPAVEAEVAEMKESEAASNAVESEVSEDATSDVAKVIEEEKK